MGAKELIQLIENIVRKSRQQNKPPAHTRVEGRSQVPSFLLGELRKPRVRTRPVPRENRSTIQHGKAGPNRPLEDDRVAHLSRAWKPEFGTAKSKCGSPTAEVPHETKHPLLRSRRSPGRRRNTGLSEDWSSRVEIQSNLTLAANGLSWVVTNPGDLGRSRVVWLAVWLLKLRP